MEIQRLQCHPSTPCTAIQWITAGAIRRPGGGLVFHYVTEGHISDLRLPQTASPRCADGLWRHTCFEAFVAGDRPPEYCEFNFAPSGAWAAYRFAGYRQDQAILEGVLAPSIEVRRTANRLELVARIDRLGLPSLRADVRLRLGLSAVIEDTGGRLSYWAVVHAPGPPDFHHPESFALMLDPADRL